MRSVPPTSEGIAEAAGILRAGGVVAYPTETVYGLAVDPLSPEALRKLFEVKGRPDANPVLLVVASTEQLARVAQPLSARAAQCASRFWPGPLSLVLHALEGLPPEIAPRGKVCVRCPGAATARELCSAFDGPITSTSANRTGAPPAMNALEVLEQLSGVDLVIDGGQLAPSAPSTVYDPDTREILRAGVIAEESLATL